MKILAVVQPFQVANELRARHPLPDVLKKKTSLSLLWFHTLFTLFAQLSSVQSGRFSFHSEVTSNRKRTKPSAGGHDLV